MVLQVKLEDEEYDEEAERRRSGDFHRPLPQSALAAKANLRAAVKADTGMPLQLPWVTDMPVPNLLSVMPVILGRRGESKPKSLVDVEWSERVKLQPAQKRMRDRFLEADHRSKAPPEVLIDGLPAAPSQFAL